ncbi:hypothetical protein Pint_16170 [Pistacia integerrima]|uniref:Uncharacterized protein n=1 Tax=Pistacia integerrima TaxID=434235 RepID=A0ACC0ZC73_9ROSI|nr:hypothetical protein Pint_16170 [Pistacia integerrima]
MGQVKQRSTQSCYYMFGMIAINFRAKVQVSLFLNVFLEFNVFLLLYNLLLWFIED